MSTTSKILQRSVTAPFYRRLAGFFLFTFFLLFGLQPNFKQTLEFHYVIISGIATSFHFFFIAVAVWFAYALKTVHFFNGCVKNKSYTFLQHLNALSPGKRFYHLVFLQVQLLAPVLLYGLAVAINALIKQQLAGAVAVVITLAGLCIFTAIAANYILQKTKTAVVLLKLPALPFHFSGTFFSFLLKFIFHEQFILLLVLKSITFSCLYFFARTDAQVFEDRMLWLLYLTCLAGHCILVYRNQHFMEAKMAFFRNLPVKPVSILLSLLGIYSLLLLPEIWALRGLAIRQHAVVNYIGMVLTGPSLLLLLHCLLYTEDMKMEGYLQLLFGVWVVGIFFSLSANRWLLPGVLLGMSVIIFLTSYARYEKNMAVEALE